MYVVKNLGQFPVIIRDLSFHLAGGKSVDLDTVFKRDTSSRSVDLTRLIDSKKLEVLNKDGNEIKEKIIEKHTVKVVNEGGKDSAVLLKLGQDMADLKELLLKGGFSPVNNQSNSDNDVDEGTLKRLAELKAKNISSEKMDVSRNFETIGKETTKEESLDDLLDVMENLEGE
jgi:hypothetical protein